MDQEDGGLDAGCCYVTEVSSTSHELPVPSQ